jgi:hypothetical protein
MEKEDLFIAEAVVIEVDAERGGGGGNLITRWSGLAEAAQAEVHTIPIRNKNPSSDTTRSQ